MVVAFDQGVTVVVVEVAAVGPFERRELVGSCGVVAERYVEVAAEVVAVVAVDVPASFDLAEGSTRRD